MRKFLLIISFAVYYFANCQDYNKKGVLDFSNMNQFTSEFPWMETFTGTKKLKSLKIHEEIEDRSYTSFYFNEHGLPVKIENSKLIYTIGFLRRMKIHKQEYDFDNSDRLTESRLFNKKGRMLMKQNYTYFTGHQLLMHQKENKGKPESKTLYIYAQDSTLTKVDHFRFSKSSEKLFSSYHYAYYPDKKPKTTLYYKKNKLKHTWNYDCDPRGKIVKKDTTLICMKEDRDLTGRKVITLHYTDSKKKEIKTVNYYRQSNGKDVFSETQRYTLKKGKEIPLYKIHYPDSVEPFLRQQFYDKTGKLVTESLSEYYDYTADSKKLKHLSWKWYGKKQKVKTSRTQSFDAEGLPLEIVVAWGKKIARIRYTLTGQDSFRINHYRNSKLKKSFVAELAYY
jgi:hypothetical protein